MQQPAKVLVVDDDELIRQFLTTGLRYEGYDVVEAEDGKEALTLAATFRPDVIVLDLLMPGTDGYEVCRRLRGRSDLGIVMLSAKDELQDRVRGLDLGGDDYLVKPFQYEELLSRIRAILRRLNKPTVQKLVAGPITLDEGRHDVKVNGSDLDLTPREFELLRFLMRHPQQVFSRQTLLDRVWGANFLGSEANVDVYVASLRTKLGPDHREMIQTVRGVGYRLK